MGSEGGPFPGPETLLHRIWLWQWRLPNPMETVDGRPLWIWEPGWWSYGPGPDLQNAILRVGDTWLRGDVEIHRDGVEWYRHGHADDSRYARVVLHVVYRPAHTPPRHRCRSDPIPEVALDRYLTVEDLQEFPAQTLLPKRPDRTRCLTYLADGSVSRLIELLERMGLAYLHWRMERVLRQWEARTEWTERLYEGIMRALGYAAWAAPMEALARAVPWSLARTIAQREGPDGLLHRWLVELDAMNASPAGYFRPTQRPDRRLAWMAALCGMGPGDPLQRLLDFVRFGLIHAQEDPRQWASLWRAWADRWTRWGDGNVWRIGRARWSTIWWNAVVPIGMAATRATGQNVSISSLKAMRTSPLEDDRIQRAMRIRFGLWGHRLPRFPLVQLGLHGMHRFVCSDPGVSCPRCPLRTLNLRRR